MKECLNCDLPLNPPRIGWLVTDPDGYETLLCSPSCLVEWAWQIKQNQVKLSKSKDFEHAPQERGDDI